MQRVYKHGYPPQRNAASDEPIAQLGQYICGAVRAPSISQSAIALVFGLGIGLELIGFVSRRILQAGAFPEQPDGDRADPLHPTLGAEVRGVDLARPVMPEVFAEIDAAFWG